MHTFLLTIRFTREITWVNSWHVASLHKFGMEQCLKVNVKVKVNFWLEKL